MASATGAARREQGVTIGQVDDRLAGSAVGGDEPYASRAPMTDVVSVVVRAVRQTVIGTGGLPTTVSMRSSKGIWWVPDRSKLSDGSGLWVGCGGCVSMWWWLGAARRCADTFTPLSPDVPRGSRTRGETITQSVMPLCVGGEIVTQSCPVPVNGERGQLFTARFRADLPSEGERLTQPGAT
jgi:hypothetical protein